jgi:hypothetical protein
MSVLEALAGHVLRVLADHVLEVLAGCAHHTVRGTDHVVHVPPTESLIADALLGVHAPLTKSPIDDAVHVHLRIALGGGGLHDTVVHVLIPQSVLL